MGVTVEVFRVEGASVQGPGFKCFGFRFRGPKRNSNSNGDRFELKRGPGNQAGNQAGRGVRYSRPGPRGGEGGYTGRIWTHALDPGRFPPPGASY